MRDYSEVDGLAIGILFASLTVYEVLPPIDDNPKEPWSPIREAERRLEAVRLLRETAFTLGFTTGVDAEPLEDALAELGRVLGQVLKVAQKLEDATEASGVRLHPRQQGGGKVATGEKGRRRTVLSECVRLLLMLRYPEWDGVKPFPKKNSEELRGWVHSQLFWGLFDGDRAEQAQVHPVFAALMGPPFFPERRSPIGAFGIAVKSNPLVDEDEIDPRSRGPLWSIINNLQRLQ